MFKNRKEKGKNTQRGTIRKDVITYIVIWLQHQATPSIFLQSDFCFDFQSGPQELGILDAQLDSEA